MFDNMKLGQYIQFLRKSAGLTQGRLAESLGVSHQAVSNWERGESMPDIALLSLLARTLGTTVDRMLAAAEDFDPKVCEAYAEAEPERQDSIEESPIESTAGKEREKAPESPEESQPATPTIEIKSEDNIPDLNATIKNVRVVIKDALAQAARGLEGFRGVKAIFSDIENDIEDVIEDAEDELGEIEEDLRDAGKKRLSIEIHMDEALESDEWPKIVSMAPFASPEALDKLVERLDLSKDTQKLISLAPFLSGETLAGLANKAIGEGDPKGWDTLAGLAPFIGTPVLDEIVLNNISDVPLSKISRLAPFLSSKAVDTLLSR